jgi:hypothetical protein
VRSISLPIAGILAAALLDQHWSWGTVASVLMAAYCHWLYRRAAAPPVTLRACAPEDELRPGWAARWGTSASTGEDDVWRTRSEDGQWQPRG